MTLFWIVRIVLHNLSTTLSHVATFNVLGGIRRQICEKLSKIPLGSVLDDNSGSYKNIIVERVDSMETTLAHIIPEFTANILLPLVMFVYLILVDWRMALANLISVLIGLIFCVSMLLRSKGEFEVTIQKTKYLNDTAVEYINGIEVIKAFGKTGSSYEKFVNAAREGADCFIRWMRKCIWPQSGMMAFMPATFLGVLPVGLILVGNKSLSAGDFITSIILSAGLIAPLLIAFSYMDDMAKMTSIFGEVTEILEREEMKRPDRAEEKPQGSDIRLMDVHFTYKDKEVLHGVNMEIRQGDVTAIVGPSGSGKSTIARLMDSLWDVDSGTITYGGVDIRKLPLDDYMSRIAYVAQDNYLFDMSVKENIRIGKADATDEEVIAAAKATGCHEFIMGLEKGYDTIAGGGKTTITSLIARFWDVQKGKVTLGGRNVKDYSFDSLMENFSFVFQRVYLFEDTIANNIRFGRPEAPMEEVIAAAKKARCHDFISSLPEGYDTVIGEGGATISGGEKQRISIARAIMKDAPIIVLDEATANVDPENEKELTEAIENLTQEKTIIMIAHRLKTVKNADQIVVIDKGRIAQKGRHEELMQEEGIYRNFVSGRRQAVSWKIA